MAPSLPQMAPDEFAPVVPECKAGWVERFKSPVFGHRPSDEELRNVYKPRLAYEFEVLRRLSFAGYFLLVQAIVRFAKSSGVLVRPSRGAVGGSLVAYLVGITVCDRIRFNLLSRVLSILTAETCRTPSLAFRRRLPFAERGPHGRDGGRSSRRLGETLRF